MKKELPLDAIPRYGLYRRVSTADQEDKDLSLPAQRRLQHEHVSRSGGAVVAEYEDGGISGTKSDNRQSFQDAIAAARRREFDVLLIHKSDRVFRNRFDAVTYKVLLKEHGVALASVTEPWVGGDEPGEKLLEGVMECVNEFYSANLSREVKKGLDEIAITHGRQAGSAPFGYGYANREAQGAGWVIVEADAVWVRRAFRRIQEGASVADIARELNAAGVPPPGASPRGRKGQARGGRHWTPTTLRYMLRNRAYAGEVTRAGVWHPGSHPLIVEPDAFQHVQDLLTRRPPGRADQSERGLFVGGLARCPRCGGVLMHIANKQCGRTGARGGEEYNSRYVCRSGYVRTRAAEVSAPIPGCEGFYISQRALLALLTDHLKAAARGWGGSPPHPRPAIAPVPRAAREQETERAGFVERLGKLNRMRAGYLDLAAEGLMPHEELRGKLEELERRRGETEALIVAAAPPLVPPRLLSLQATSLLGALADTNLTIRQQRDALRLVIDYLIPWPPRDGIDVYLRY